MYSSPTKIFWRWKSHTLGQDFSIFFYPFSVNLSMMVLKEFSLLKKSNKIFIQIANLPCFLKYSYCQTYSQISGHLGGTEKFFQESWHFAGGLNLLFFLFLCKIICVKLKNTYFGFIETSLCSFVVSRRVVPQIIHIFYW